MVFWLALDVAHRRVTRRASVMPPKVVKEANSVQYPAGSRA